MIFFFCPVDISKSTTTTTTMTNSNTLTHITDTQKRLEKADFFSLNVIIFDVFLLLSSKQQQRSAIKILRCYRVYIIYVMARATWMPKCAHPAHPHLCPYPSPSARLLSKLSSTCQNNNQPYNVNRSPIQMAKYFFPSISFRFVSFMVCGLTFQFLSLSVLMCMFVIFSLFFFLEKCSSHIIIKVFLVEIPKQKH